jgi:hypothetical protein
MQAGQRYSPEIKGARAATIHPARPGMVCQKCLQPIAPVLLRNITRGRLLEGYLGLRTHAIQFIEILKSEETPETTGGLSLRRVFCEFLAACTYVTLARAEDHTETYVSA